MFVPFLVIGSLTEGISIVDVWTENKKFFRSSRQKILFKFSDFLIIRSKFSTLWKKGLLVSLILNPRSKPHRFLDKWSTMHRSWIFTVQFFFDKQKKNHPVFWKPDRYKNDWFPDWKKIISKTDRIANWKVYDLIEKYATAKNNFRLELKYVKYWIFGYT